MSPRESSSSSHSSRVSCDVEVLPVVADEVDPRLEAQAHDPLDLRFVRRAVRLQPQLDVVRPHPGVADPVHRPDEAHHERVRRLVVELARRRDLLDAALVHDDDGVGELERLLLVVRDEDRRHVHLVVEAEQPLAQLLAHAGVERAERLVEQEHLRLGSERTRERHALPLAAGELRRIAAAEPGELHELEQLGDARADLALRAAADAEPEGDVVPDRHVRERGVVLEDEADAALLRRERRRLLAGDEHVAGVGHLEPGDHAQQRRLAAAARAEQRGERAALDEDRDVVDRDEVPESLRDVTRLDRHRVPLVAV